LIKTHPISNFFYPIVSYWCLSEKILKNVP
jgi:hypothetical protein